MGISTHDSGSGIVTGRVKQIRYVLAGKAVVLKKGQTSDQDTTDYLKSTPANNEHLQRGLEEFRRGEFKARATK